VSIEEEEEEEEEEKTNKEKIYDQYMTKKVGGTPLICKQQSHSMAHTATFMSKAPINQ
jgi:hypothetical protein